MDVVMGMCDERREAQFRLTLSVAPAGFATVCAVHLRIDESP